MEKPKLLDQLRKRHAPQALHYRTEDAYIQWIKRDIHFHSTGHPLQMREAEILAFSRISPEKDTGFILAA